MIAAAADGPFRPHQSADFPISRSRRAVERDSVPREQQLQVGLFRPIPPIVSTVSLETMVPWEQQLRVGPLCLISPPFF